MLDLKVEELNAYIYSSVDNAWMAVCDPERECGQAHGRVGVSLLPADAQQTAMHTWQSSRVLRPVAVTPVHEAF
jgi:hypothetical protein